MRTTILTLLLLTSAAHANTIELYATTDLHGHLEASPWRGHTGHDAARSMEGGGLALLGGFLKNARAHYPGHVLLLDGGDLFQGTLASNLSEGASMMRGLNQLGYAAAALGNHEFDYGPVGTASTPGSGNDDPRGALKQRMKEAHFPILGANVVGKDGSHPFKSWTMATVDGVPIGIVGGTSESLFQTTVRDNLVGLSVTPLGPALIEAAQDAVAHGARVIIATVHAGAECQRAPRALTDRDHDDLAGCKRNEELERLAHALARSGQGGGPRFSAIVAGHTHQPSTMIIDGIPIIQSGQNGHYLSHLSLDVTGTGAQSMPTGRFAMERSIEVCERYGKNDHCASIDDKEAKRATYFGEVVPDPDVVRVISDDLMQSHRLAARELGITLPEGLPTVYSAENPLGNLVADSLRAGAHADVGIMNGGGVRAPLPKGPLTFGALYETFPFDNELVAIDLTGAQLQRIVEKNLHTHFGALSFSGLHVKAACVDGHSKIALDVGGTPLDPAKTYRVGTVDFLAHGGDGMLEAPVKVPEHFGTVRAVLESALAKHGGTMTAKEPGLYDPAHRRVELPMPRPVHCPADPALPPQLP